MHPSSRKMRENMANSGERMQRPADLRMDHQQQRIMRNISATRNIHLSIDKDNRKRFYKKHLTNS